VVAPVGTVTEAVAPSTLREERAAEERLDQPSINAKEGRRVALEELKARPIGIVEHKDDARGIFARGEISRVSEPMGREKNLSTIADSITGKFMFEIGRGGSRTIRATMDGDNTNNDVAEARNGNPTSTRTERGAQDIVEDRDILRGKGAFEGVDEVFPEGVGQGPAAREELKRGVHRF